MNRGEQPSRVPLKREFLPEGVGTGPMVGWRGNSECGGRGGRWGGMLLGEVAEPSQTCTIP